jgi:RHS repeat-associated protein
VEKLRVIEGININEVSYGDSTQLLYLRSRFYNPADGRFQSRDKWEGSYNSPQSLNRWSYIEANPVNRVDPSGMCYNPDGTWNWSNWHQWLNFGPCPSSIGQSNVPQPTVTPSPTPTPKSTCTPTVISTPTPTLILLGQWKITYYVIATEAEFPAVNPYDGISSDYVPVAGLQGKYRRQFIYSSAGVYGQGTGKSESGDYITIDWTTNNQKYGSNWPYDMNRPVSDLYFKKGKGGATGDLIDWETVAINQNEPQLTYGDKVMIDGYNKIFKVGDTGTFPDISHLDIFIGEVPRQVALDLGTKHLNVWKVIGQ